MANVNPFGINTTTGRLTPLSPGDMLTNSSGAAAVGSTGIQGVTGIAGASSAVAAGSYTPVGSFNTNTTYSGHYEITETIGGYRFYALIALSFSGLPNSTICDVQVLPAGWNVDETRVVNSANAHNHPAGHGTLTAAGVVRGPIVPFYIGTETTGNCRMIYTNATGTFANMTQAAPVSLANGDVLMFHVTLPVTPE